MAKEKKYSAADEAMIRDTFEANAGADKKAIVDKIVANFAAQNVTKTRAQVRSKAVLMGLYRADPKATTTSDKDTGPRKKDLQDRMEAMGFDPTAFEGTRKDGLAAVVDRLEAMKAETTDEDDELLDENEMADEVAAA